MVRILGSVRLRAVRSPHFCRRLTHLSLHPRANISRPFRLSSTPVVSSQAQACPHRTPSCPPSRRRAALAHPPPPDPAQPHHIPLPHPSSALLAPVNRLSQRAHVNMIRGQRLCGRCMEESESVRDEPVSHRRTPTIPRRRQH